MPLKRLSLKGRALRLLAQREHSKHELTQKLKQHESFEGELQAVLDDLEGKGFISEQRVAASLLHQKAPRFGTMRVLHELKHKGLDQALIEQAAQTLKETEYERAQAVWLTKFGKPQRTPPDYAKQARFMASRGFNGDVIARLLRSVPSFHNENSDLP